METSASFEVRSAPLPYSTMGDRPRSEPVRSRAMGLYLAESCDLESQRAGKEETRAYGRAPKSRRSFTLLCPLPPMLTPRPTECCAGPVGCSVQTVRGV